MNRGNQLYNLIKTLSRGEKRHFNLLNSKYSTERKNIVITLFETIDSLNEWDEEKFKLRLEKNNISKHISVHINMLIEHILNSLRIQEQQNNKLFIVNKLIEESYILHSRNELDLAIKRNQKAKKIALSAEIHIKLNEILLQERNIQFQRLTNETFNKFRNKNTKESKDNLMILSNQTDYLSLVNDIFYIYRSIGYPQEEIEQSQYAEIIDQPLLKDINNAKSSNAKSSYYFIHSLYLGLNEFQEASEIVIKQAEIYEQNLPFLQTNVNAYISILNNLLVLQSQLDNIANFRKTLQKLRELPSRLNLDNSFIQWRIFETSYSTELDQYITKNMIDEMDVIVPIILKKANAIRKKGFLFERFLNLALRIAIYYYRKNQLDETHNWIDKILNNSATKSMYHIISYTLLLDLIVHFKLGSYSLVEYKIQTTLNFFKNQKRLIPVNILFFKTLRKLILVNDMNKAKAILNSYSIAFNKCKDSTTKRYFSEYLRIEDWVVMNFDIEQKFK